jgi:Flp pilus assembly protein TadG
MGNDLLLWIKEERGATFVVVALLIIVLVGVAALAIDIGHLFVVRNELQNASDAGCLAGGRFL